MYKLDLEKAEEPEMKLPTYAGSQKKQGNSKKHLLLLHWTMLKPLDHNTLWNIPKETGISDYIICLLRNLYAGQEATVRTGHRTDWFQIGKEVCQGCILSPCLFNLYAKKHKLESRLPGEISITSDMQMTPPLWQKVKRNSKAS